LFGPQARHCTERNVVAHTSKLSVGDNKNTKIIPRARRDPRQSSKNGQLLCYEAAIDVIKTKCIVHKAAKV